MGIERDPVLTIQDANAEEGREALLQPCGSGFEKLQEIWASASPQDLEHIVA